jgi:hypothetical protein
MRKVLFVALLAGILLNIDGCTGGGPSSSASPRITAMVSPSANAAGWNNTDVSVRFICSGTTSAIVYCQPPVLVQTQGPNQVITGTTTDGAGNTASATVILNIDKTPPTITAIADPSPNAVGWNNTDVSVSFVCSDAMSAIASCPQPVFVQTEGQSQVITGTARDGAGNTASASVTLNVDKTPPVAAITTPLQGQFFGASPITVQGTINDVSGLATATCNGAAATLSGSSFSCNVSLVSGQNTVTIAATDLAGNAGSSSVTVMFEVAALELAYVEDLQLVWWTPRSSSLDDWNSFAAFYNPVVPQGYYSLGSYGEAITESSNAPAPAGFMLVAKDLADGALAKPVDYTNVWSSSGQLGEPAGSFWQPVPPPGYVCLGMVAQSGYNKPDLDEIRCVRQDLTVAGQVANGTVTGEVDSEVWNSGLTTCVLLCGTEAAFGTWQVIAEDPYALITGALVGSDSTTVQPSGPFHCLDARRVKGAVDGFWKLSSQDVTQLVQKYGPQLELDPNEIFLPDDTGYSLNFAKLEWGLLEDANYSTFNLQILGSMPTSGAGLMNDVDSHVKIDLLSTDPAFRQWLRMPTEWGAPYTTTGGAIPPGFIASGDLSRARADIRVVPWNYLFTELQFWLYYPFNGPGRVKICITTSDCNSYDLNENGRHYSDWEHVTLRILNSTQELVGVFMSEHGGGRWFAKRDFGSALQFSDTHPLVYVAKYSHAHYPTPGVQYYERPYQLDIGVGTVSVDLYDETGSGQFYRVYEPSSYEVVSSAVPGYQVSEPDWVQFQGLWGQYEQLSDTLYFWVLFVHAHYTYTSVGNGPAAPIVNDCWTKGEFGPGSWGFRRHP